MANGAAKPTPDFSDVRRLGEVDSTNRRLADLAREAPEEAQGVVIVAEYQTDGRGRRGRSWEAPPGSSLLVSVLVGPLEPDRTQLTTVCAALAAADACEEVSGAHPSLKWPNDLLFGANKVGGILAEAMTPHAVVVGLGVNIDWGNVDLPEGATSLALVPGARRVERDALLMSYLRHMRRRCESLGRADRVAGLLDDYRRSCVTLGRRVTVDLGPEQITGVATGIGDNGNLLLTTDAGGREVAAGDVVHLDKP